MKKKILIVIADFYPVISKELLRSAQNELKSFTKVRVIKVPGSFEIPITISKNIKKFDGFLALGCVIKGETPHFEYISRTIIDAIMNISLKYNKPIGNGVLTCLTSKQAMKRAFNKKKGKEAAKALISLLSQK